jgi:hypothetical protein
VERDHKIFNQREVSSNTIHRVRGRPLPEKFQEGGEGTTSLTYYRSGLLQNIGFVKIRKYLKQNVKYTIQIPRVTLHGYLMHSRMNT